MLSGPFLLNINKTQPKVNSKQQLQTFSTQIANNKTTSNINSWLCAYFMKLDISEKFIGKILHSSKQGLPQIEYKEIML